MNLPSRVHASVRLHVFSNKPVDVAEAAKSYGLGSNVYSNPYLSYMEFLSATKLFDALLVNDVEHGPGLPINPFLPSKYSDYLGSGRKIFALVDEGSPLSQMPVDYRAERGNVPHIIGELTWLVAESLVATE